MQPNDPLPAPPPITPSPPNSNPYSFITDKPRNPKKTFFSGNTKKQRTIVVVVGAVLLFILASVIIYVFGAGGRKQAHDWLTLAQQQSEAIRISNVGATSATDKTTKNMAITSSLVLQSQQPSITKFAKKAGANTAPSSLAKGKNLQTDAQLQAAKQANNFDSAFAKTLQLQLLDYSKSLKNLYDNSNDKKVKAVLSADFDAVKPLLETSQPQ